jgi:hypothetical protein
LFATPHKKEEEEEKLKIIAKTLSHLKHRSSEADTTGEAEEEDDDDGMVDNAENATEGTHL